MLNVRLAGVMAIATLIVGSLETRAAPSDRLAVLGKQLTLLEQEAGRVQAAHDIRRLQRAYGYYLDEARWDAMADLFTKDGSIEIALDGVYVGQKRIREYLYALGGGRSGLRPGQLNDHLELQPVVNVSADGRTAKGRWRALIMSGQHGESATWSEGPYEVEYARQNGVWKISRLHWYQTYMVPYAGGWTKNKDLTNGILASRQLPPDRPPSETYGVWPNVYVPPFHYKNPTADAMPAMALDTETDADASVAALQRTIEQLHQRIQLLHDRDAVENLISMYGYYLDKQQWDLLTDLFTEDGTMEISQRGVYVGHKSIRGAFELFGPQNIEPNHLHNHIQLQPLINVDPDGKRALVRSRALSQLGTFGSAGVWGDGVYENEFVKVNGVWKIHKDHVYTTFFTTYDEGWAFGSRPTPKPSGKIPPDRPASEKYESFPEVYTPPFHYTSVASTTPEPIAITRVPSRFRPTLQRLARTVSRLEDENAIENLQRAYGFYVDKGLWQEATDLFAGNGKLEIAGRGSWIGRAQILQHLTSLAPDGLTRGRLMNELQLQPIVHVGADGATAKGRWHFLAEIGEWQRSQSWRFGVSENDYIKENGVWKLAALRAWVRVDAPYAGGWAKSAPDPFVPPFHYRHPVTGK